MLDPPDPDPGSAGPTGPLAPRLEAVNLREALVLLSDGSLVPITVGLDSLGDECGLDDPDLCGFVFGSDDGGWWFGNIADLGDSVGSN